MGQGARRSASTFGLACSGVLLAVLLAYANHFHNSFHFDDFHSVTDNPAIRSLSNIPRFFTDARTFSVLPSNQSYRPLVSATLAVDYRLSGGLNPLWFHISTFVWYLALLALMYLLFVPILEQNRTRDQARWFALFAVACYGLHPVSAETVNYIVQRADIYPVIGVVASLWIYHRRPGWRKFGIYLLPIAVSSFAKPTGLVFPGILFMYDLLFESDSRNTPYNWSAFGKALRASLPALAACAGLAVFGAAMTPKTFVAGTISRSQYWITQPFVLARYFKTFFLPTGLTADTDLQPLAGMFTQEFLIGLVFIGALIVTAWMTGRSQGLRPVAFGLAWFVLASLPTSLIALSEVENDHRMFFPFVGLVLAVCAVIAECLDRYSRRLADSAAMRAALCASAAAVLAVLAYGTHLRNEVWRSEESLFQDVTIKSPHNGRGLMNYGITQMQKGNNETAYDYFKKAAEYNPNYFNLEINLGIAAGQLGRDAEAEQHFQRAVALDPNRAEPYSYYGRWLDLRGRTEDAVSALTKSAELSPAYLMPRFLLMQIYSRQLDWTRLKQVADEVLRLAPGDPEGKRFEEMATKRPSRMDQLAAAPATPEKYLEMSLLLHRAGRYEECIRLAQEALKLKPDYVEAYNNIAAGYQSLGQWDNAIAAAQEALRLKPDYQLAKNNLAYAQSQKARMTASSPSKPKTAIEEN